MELNKVSETEEHPLSRYVPLVIWVVAVMVGLLIPLKILSIGYMPSDDALRHVAKVVSGKAWSDIVVLRDGFTMDEHAGWHAILGVLHSWFSWGTDDLLTFSICALFVLFWLAVLAFWKRPEAMIIAAFIASLIAGGTFTRPMLGRPFIVVMAVAVTLLRLWTKPCEVSVFHLLLTTVLIAFSVWVHGSWYLFGLLVASSALVGEWKKTFALAGCWVVGTFWGACLTGHPLGYLNQTFRHLLLTCLGNTTLERMLTVELTPDPGSLAIVAAAAMMMLWRLARGEWRNETVCNPLFAMAALGWFLGLKITRFWTDWGFPAALLWLATEFEAVLESKVSRQSFHALWLACFAALGVYLSTTRDVANRWTSNVTVEYLSADKPEFAGCLPDKGGIIYNSDMEVFFRTFYKNPKGDWRYILGFEPALMPPEDFEILRKIQWNWYTSQAYKPWVDKMRPQDRMILLRPPGAPPQIAGLEWRYAATDTWIGTLPKKAPANNTKP